MKPYKAVALGRLEFVYIPRYKWDRKILFAMHEANHKQLYWHRCPICRLAKRQQKPLDKPINSEGK